MDFSFSSDQQLLKNSARAFLDEHCKPAAVRLLWDDPRGESDTMWKEMAQLGWLGLSLPEAYGGSGLGMVESAILLEELGRAAYPGPYWPTVLAADAVEAAGNDAQKKRWLSAIATGDARATLALLDADLDWDPAAMTARAEKTAKGWALSGTKRFVPWAHVANALLIPARAPEGPSLFLVDPASAGLKLSPVQGMDLATRWVHVDMDKVPVVPEALLGAPGQAAPLLSSLLRRGAVCATDAMLGAARRVRRGHCCRVCSLAARSAPPARCWVPRAGAWTWRSATRRCASSSASRSARSRRSATSAPRCCWRSRTRTRPSITRRGRSTRRPRTASWRRRWPRRTWATPRARSAARRSRCTAASASRGSTTCTSTSSAPRRSSRCTATSTTTASRSSAGPRGSAERRAGPCPRPRPRSTASASST